MGQVMSTPIPSVKVHGRTLTPGVEVSIYGARGRFRYQYATRSDNGSVSLTFVGGPTGHEAWHSFRPERVRRVHRLCKTRVNLKDRAS